MDSNDFAILTARLERESDINPRLYTLKVMLVAALGYAPLALLACGVLLAFFSLLYSLLVEGRASAPAVLGGAACVMGLLVTARSLVIRIDAPGGRDITADEAPALFAAIDDVLERMSIEKNGKTRPVAIEAVTLDGSFDARVHQLPRWGVLTPVYRNQLQLGVPLLTALSIAELKAVLAHEIGHFGRSHERFEAWIYRQRTTWRMLQRKFERPTTFADRILARFYGWYALYFQAYTLVLARNLEYSADRAAAKATHPGALANALTKIVLMGRFLEEEFWPRLMEQVEKSPQPPYLPYSMMPRAFGLAQKQWSRQDWLERSLRTFAAEGDTHPSLGERFAALNIQPAPPTYSPDRCALSLLGSHGATIIKWCDEGWQKENAVAWRQRHNAIKESRWKIEEYEKTPAADLKPEDLWQKALLILDLGQYENAIDELQFLVARAPGMAKAHLLLGKLLLQRGDERGLENLTLAAKHDAQVLEDAGGAGYNYLVDRGRKGEAQRFWERLYAA